MALNEKSLRAVEITITLTA